VSTSSIWSQLSRRGNDMSVAMRRIAIVAGVLAAPSS